MKNLELMVCTYKNCTLPNEYEFLDLKSVCSHCGFCLCLSVPVYDEANHVDLISLSISDTVDV